MPLDKQDRSLPFILTDIFLFSLTFYLVIASWLDLSDVGWSRVNVLTSLANNLDLNVPMGTGIKGIDGRDYSWFGIGSVILGLPVFILGKLAGLNPSTLQPLVNMITSATTNCLIFLFSFSLGYSKRISAITSLIYGFATTACYYAKDPGDHSIETFFVLLAVYCMHRHTITDKMAFVAYSAFSIGFAIITRPNAVVAIPAILLLPFLEYLSKGHSREKLKQLAIVLCTFFIGLIPFAALFMWYNHYRFGSVFETGHRIMASQMGLDFFSGTSLLTGLSGFLISPSKGFFYYSPPAIFFFLSIRSFSRSHLKIAICFITLICSYFLFYSKNIYWHGDWAWGPRYVLATLPFFIIPVGSLFNGSSRLLKSCIYAVVAVSLLIQILAISINPIRYFIYLQLHENIQFTVAQGNDMPPIVEPPPSLYFDWHKSPLLYQVKFFHESYNNMFNYKYSANSNSESSGRTILSQPFMNVYDFGWVYTHYTYNFNIWFLCSILLLIISILCGRNLYIHAIRQRPN
ncbi:MAG: glycosyltransferase family 39 protein [Desulfuromonadaceae bacterium]|nr:glycosyltransferase family 39 protein [Desulfuromonadaceae bacterium]